MYIVQTVAKVLKNFADMRSSERFCTFLAAGQSQEITFADLYERSRAYARMYVKLGVVPGDLILVILKHTPHLFYAYLGAMLAGAVPSYLPFPTPKQRPDLYWEDHNQLFNRIGPRLIVTYEENFAAAQQTLPNFHVPTLIAADSILQQDRSEARARDEDFAGFLRAPDDIACLQHSSGTTSLKKGVMLTHRMIFDHVAAYNAAIEFGNGDSIASWLPLYHDMGFIACFMGSLLSGTHLVALDPFEWVIHPRLLLDAIERYRTTFCWLPNFAFSHIANAARPKDTWDLSSMRSFINCSEPCKPKTFERFAARFASCGIDPSQLQVCYAMAENVFAVTQTPLRVPARVVEADPEAFSLGEIAAPTLRGGPAIRILSCGSPVKGVNIEIRDSSSRPVSEGNIGEICVSGPFLFSGYYRMPEKTGEKLRHGWYYTGDMGFTMDGELFVTGRKDDMLIVAGRNYYAHELEAIVGAVPEIIPGRAVAIGVEDPRTDATAVVLLAECTDSADPATMGQEIRREILEKVGLAIHAFVPLPAGSLVKTTSGKISRNKNKELYVAGRF